ncbi:MAG: hypothetical protein IPP72_13030 [Chitinophagaceae bacterium]|nr:hypothetical protein [Chitinophagaceae bacterium]
MKNIFLLSIGFLLMRCAIAQSLQTRISRYAIPRDNGMEKVLVLKMPYAHYNIEAIIGDTVALRSAGEMMVDIICTDYPTEQSLAALNANRLAALYKAFPFINNSQINRVTYYRQTGGGEKEKALPMFHGVVVRYRAAQNATTIKNDLEKLEELLAYYEKKKLQQKKTASLRGEDIRATPTYTPEKKSTVESNGKPPYYDPSMSLKGKKITYIIGDETYLRSRFSIPDSQRIVDFKTAYKKDLITKRVYQQFNNKPKSYLTLYVPLAEEIPDEGKDTTDTIDYTPPPQLIDSTITEVLKRNNWKNIAMVADVTGSMYPYSGQLLVWLQQYSTDSLTKNFLFFNDGDDKPDDKKKPGKTGGIYSRYCSSYDEVKAMLKLAMQRGAGGDFPENTIEALLAAEKQFPDATGNVLIADNWANIRDKELTGQLKKPVKIILCAVKSNRINTDYLNLAFRTKGSLHLIGQDLTDLSLLQEGEIIRAGKTSYKISNGEFIELDINGEPVSSF